MKFLKTSLLIVTLLLSAGIVKGADLSTTTCPGAGCVNYNVGGQGSIGIQVTGTWVGTITFQSTIDNSTYTSFRVVSSADTASTGITTTTGNGSFQGTITGINQVRVVFTAYTSGTAVVTSRTTNQSAKFSGGGGGGGTPGGSNTQVQFNDSSSFGGDADLIWDKTKNYLGIGGFTSSGVNGIYIKTIDNGGILNFLIQNTESTSMAFPGAANFQMASTPAMGVNVGEAWALILDNSINGAGSADALHGLEIHNQVIGGTVTSQEALLIDDVAGATTNYAIKTGTGQVSFGDKVTSTLYVTSGSGLSVANVGANSCGTTAATIAGNSNSFEITVGATAGTQCRVTFPTAAPNRMNCTVTDATTTIATRSTAVDTTHVDFLGAFVAGDKVVAICLPR